MADTNRANKSSRRETTEVPRVEAVAAPARHWRVAVVASQLEFNGLTLYTVTLVKALLARGDEVLLLSPDGPLRQHLPAEGLTFIELPSPPRRLGLFAWRNLKAEVGEFEPDLVHASSIQCAPVAVQLAKALEIARCVTIHGTAPGELPTPGSLNFDAYIAADQSVRENLINDCGVPREMNTLITTAAFAMRPPDQRRVLDPRTKPVVGCLGPLLPNTGHKPFVEAAVNVCARHPDAMFTVLGNGPMRAEIRQMIEDKGLMQRIVMVERLFDYSLAWQPFDVIFVDSRQPAASSLALAAMANGLPVVASEGGVLFDVIEDGEDGVLVARDNAPDLAEKLLKLLQDPAERLRLGTNAYNDVEARHAPAAMAAALDETYAAMVGGDDLPRGGDGAGTRKSTRAQA